MATYQFTATESLGIPEQITLTDTTISPDPGLTSRRVSLRLANGSWLDSSGNQSTTIVYITWSISDASIILNVLSRSTTIDITVEWLTGSTPTGVSTVLNCFSLFDYLFAYNLIGAQTSSPGIIQDANYYSNFSAFIVNLFCAEVATSTGNDLYSSQAAFDRNFFMEQNENDFF